MWCTRWYLPLVLLPIPIAPPYFLLLFLFSTTMHARPCFYCMVLLTAMFMSTCYWPPIPIETPLVHPWSKNVTTFADALQAIMPNIPEEMIPSSVAVADRCWCDLSNGFFAPFNATRWEELSVVRLKDKLEKEIAAEQRAKEKEDCENAEGVEGPDESSACNVPEVEESKQMPASPLEEIWGTRTLLEILWDAAWSFRHTHRRPETTAVPPPDTDHEPETTPTELEKFKVANYLPDEEELSSSASSHEPPTVSPSWLRREYDLRRFGFAMVLDFGWSGTHP